MEQQTVVVTGASAGIGRATARLFGERGWSVGLIARGQEGLEGAAREVGEAGGKAVAVSADVADYEQVTILANKVAPALLDRYLARTGYRSQQTAQPADPRQPDNLLTPVDGIQGQDHGPHGAFD